IKSHTDRSFANLCWVFLGHIRILSPERKRQEIRDGSVRTLENVVLMTPEQIHVNSFMYEPILDMSDDHLRKLLGDVKKLK
ncbi:hypothetical protein, partial [Cryobacterium lyxosi]